MHVTHMYTTKTRHKETSHRSYNKSWAQTGKQQQQFEDGHDLLLAARSCNKSKSSRHFATSLTIRITIKRQKKINHKKDEREEKNTLKPRHACSRLWGLINYELIRTSLKCLACAQSKKPKDLTI